MNGVLLLFLAGMALLLNSCVTIPGRTYVPPEKRKPAPRHYYHTARTPDLEGSALLGVPKLNPVWWGKNSDTPLPDWWIPEEADQAKRKRTWHRRNPMHNFTHYVIGVADRDFHRAGINASGVWNPNGRVNLAVTHAGPLIHLPFVSHKGKKFESYLGWRNAGNFGIAFRKAE